MWPFGRRRQSKRFTVFIGEGPEFDGRCRFTGTAIVDGRITGDSLSADHFVVGATATVTSGVNATVVIVRGTVTGDIVAAERVELAATARVTGDIETPALTMHAGAVIDGHCRITRTRNEAQPTGVIVPLAR